MKNTRKLFQDTLRQICEDTHANCTSSCPVYHIMYEEGNGKMECQCFKNGPAMLKFIERKSK